ncbi:ATP-binding protein [Nocardiopsis sp. HUAS JQ3]|uniref:ATP-binding protein n=1 Tax=Nocardiopsis sp. HUAS JQ3 TaxID=3061629 RepID=UPI0023A9D89E|nr:ATP-binding protein [Nocardiopsis sp. HUAS JQ3]WDZ90373.1 ATP-binding protein [Nocardiopsis sp. HUAS JQ3]
MTTTLTPAPAPEPMPSPPRRASTWWEHRVYRSDLAQARQVRADLRADLAGFDPDLVDTVLLCAAELVANAVKYAPEGREFLRALALLDERTLWLAVVDEGGGTGLPRIPDDRSDDEWSWAEGQRGLMLVDSLAQAWGHYPVGPGSARLGLGVWATFPVSPDERPLGLPGFVMNS